VRIWIDIENPPQVQYLLPLKSGFEAAGAEVVVTARDYGETYDLLRARDTEFLPVGRSYGSGKLRKIMGLLGRTQALRAALGRERPSAVVHAGRAAALAARTLGAASFAICDYEFSDLTADRIAGSYVLFPDAIAVDEFRRKGFREERLIGFSGLKEDLTFAGMDLDAISPHRFDAEPEERLVRVLVRPAAEESHYYRAESGEITLELLRHLSGRSDAVVVFSPRYPRQAEYLTSFPWATPPIVLDRALPFVSLLKSVDAVVSSGGTMIREAAYLGVPAYSTFRGEQGGVDRFLETAGRLRFLSTPEDFSTIRLEKTDRLDPLASNPALRDELVADVLARA
jgi:predicted glycosyltransferase